MAFVAAATLGAGLVGAGASIWGANKAADTQSAAAAQAAQAQKEALNFQKGIFDYQKGNFTKTTGDLDPFIKSGTGATNLLSSFYGLNGQPALNDNALSQFYNSPDYKFALKGGGEALDNSLAAKGGALGGNAIKAQTEFGQGLATQNLTNYLSRIGAIAGQGIQAGGILGQIGANIGTGSGANVGNTSNNLGNTLMAGGTADASGILGTVKGFQGGLNSLQQYNQMTQSSYGSGNGSTWGAPANSPYYGPLGANG